MRAEGLIRKRVAELQGQSDRCAGAHSDMMSSDARLLRWVLFDNECPECHVDCSEYNDCTKDPIEEKWSCNNCGWIGDRNTKGVERS